MLLKQSTKQMILCRPRRIYKRAKWKELEILFKMILLIQPRMEIQGFKLIQVSWIQANWILVKSKKSMAYVNQSKICKQLIEAMNLLDENKMNKLRNLQ